MHSDNVGRAKVVAGGSDDASQPSGARGSLRELLALWNITPRRVCVAVQEPGATPFAMVDDVRP